MLNSIRTKLIILSILLVLGTSLVVGMLSFVLIKKLNEENARHWVKKTEAEYNDDFNNRFGEVERTATVLYDYIYHLIGEDVSTLEDDDIRGEIIASAGELAHNLVEKNINIVDAYLDFNKNASYAGEGFNYIRYGDALKAEEPPDVKSHEEHESEYVIWYYKALNSDGPIWIDPYYDAELQMQIASYVIPIRINGEFVGLVGIDVKASLLRDMVAGVSLYNSGYGFLIGANKDVIYGPYLRTGKIYSQLDPEDKEFVDSLDAKRKVVKIREWEIKGEDVWVTYQKLNNDMTFGTVVKKDEVYNTTYSYLIGNILLGIWVIFIAGIITFIVVRHILRPLGELTRAAGEIAKGNYKTELTFKSENEFGKLADAFRSMEREIDNRFAYVNGLAFTDKMTGLNNRAAFDHDADNAVLHSKSGGKKFAIIATDINNLKPVNDIKGHTAGDELICGVANNLKEVFGERNAYRVGGDEMCVILRDIEEDAVEEKIAMFRKAIGEFSDKFSVKYGFPVSVAVGRSIFNPDVDDSFARAYVRADEEMYVNKAKMKKTLRI